MKKEVAIGIAVGAIAAVASIAGTIIAINNRPPEGDNGGNSGNVENPDIECAEGEYRVCGPVSDGGTICTCSEDPNIVLKPMIYLYPLTETAVHVELGNPQDLTVSYPQYQQGWDVTAQPGGKLVEKSGREYYGLYWEGKNGNFKITDEGFVVSRGETEEFLEEKLRILGLNDREANEFIVYWLPILQENEFNYVRFASLDEIDSYMPLSVTPEADTVIRVYMVTKPVEAGYTIQEQVLSPAPERKGFTVVEWGGTK